MCGIFGMVSANNNRAAQTVLEGLKKLEYRGYDSWGIALISKSSKSLLVEKHIGKIGEASTRLPAGNVALGHTRWATHGGVTDNNAHPHLDCSKKFAVIHNGIVENYHQLKIQLVKHGHRFISETDTEVIAHLIEENVKKENHVKAVFISFKQLVGSNAIAVLDFKNNQIIACRDGSPLVAGLGINEYFLASDVPAFLKYTNKVYYLNDNQGIVLSQKNITLYNLDSLKEIKIVYKKIDWKIADAEKAGYPHYLLKEIMEQPKTILKTSIINEKIIKKIAEKIKKNKYVIITACGTAYYCALTVKYFFANTGIRIDTYPAYEYLPFSKFISRKTVFIAISQSGETADTLIATKNAKKRGAFIVAIVNARGSTLERIADATIPVCAGPEIAVVSTKAFTSQLATLFLISRTISNSYKQGREEIKKLSNKLLAWMSQSLLNKIKKLATKIINHKDMFIIGKYINYPAGLEFALKIKESSYIHSEAFAAGELKHGVITLIQKDIPCFVLANNDAVTQEVLSSAAELKARGGYIIGVSPFTSKEFNDIVKTPDLNELTIFPNIITGQLLGYYLGVGRGTDPDKPRNLAKSVTVK